VIACVSTALPASGLQKIQHCFPARVKARSPPYTVHLAVSFRHLLLIPTLFVVACSQKPEEDPDPKPAPRQEEKAPEVVEPELPKPVDPGLTFVVPVSTNELMTDEKRKTVVGPVAPPPAQAEEDNAIDVDPPKLPEATLPDEG